MGRNWAALLVLSFFLFLANYGIGEDLPGGESPVVRGVNPARPLRVRILLEEREASHPLTLRGAKLIVNGESLRDSELVCRYTTGLASGLTSELPLGLPLGLTTEWVCKGKAKFTAKSTLHSKVKSFRGKITIRSSDDFLHIGKSFYRDTIRLIPKGQKLLVVNELELESYLVGIVNSEITSKYPREAIKAQVVAARSYALACVQDRKRTRSYDLDSTEMDQVYKGAQVEDPMSHFAVHETRGEILTNMSGQVVKAFYHASSGGSLETPEGVWSSARAKDEKVYSYRDPAAKWDDDLKWKISFGAWMGLKFPGLGLLRDMQIVERSPSDRVKKLLLVGEMNSKVIRGSELRKIFGGRWLKSTLFNVEQKGTSWILEGRGFGHGVGMSQRGAKKLALRGWGYDKILSAYYPGASLGKMSIE